MLIHQASVCSVQIVYVAPMKALAAEMTNYFSKRLEPLGIVVKELTGDMQLSKSEILRTQVCFSPTSFYNIIFKVIKIIQPNFKEILTYNTNIIQQTYL